MGSVMLLPNGGCTRVLNTNLAAVQGGSLTTGFLVGVLPLQNAHVLPQLQNCSSCLGLTVQFSKLKAILAARQGGSIQGGGKGNAYV